MGQDKIGIILAMEGAEPLESGIELFICSIAWNPYAWFHMESTKCPCRWNL